MDNLTRQLAAYVTSRRFDDIPADIVRSATRHLVDAIGCALGGRDCEAARIGRNWHAALRRTGMPDAFLASGDTFPRLRPPSPTPR